LYGSCEARTLPHITLRETPYPVLPHFSFRYLVEHQMVDVVVCTAGGIEEDLIKCMGHTYVGDFNQFKGDA